MKRATRQIFIFYEKTLFDNGLVFACSAQIVLCDHHLLSWAIEKSLVSGYLVMKEKLIIYVRKLNESFSTRVA
jgi:hypothetical protein